MILCGVLWVRTPVGKEKSVFPNGNGVGGGGDEAEETITRDQETLEEGRPFPFFVFAAKINGDGWFFHSASGQQSARDPVTINVPREGKV